MKPDPRLRLDAAAREPSDDLVFRLAELARASTPSTTRRVSVSSTVAAAVAVALLSVGGAWALGALDVPGLPPLQEQPVPSPHVPGPPSSSPPSPDPTELVPGPASGPASRPGTTLEPRPTPGQPRDETPRKAIDPTEPVDPSTTIHPSQKPHPQGKVRPTTKVHPQGKVRPTKKVHPQGKVRPTSKPDPSRRADPNGVAPSRAPGIDGQT